MLPGIFPLKYHAGIMIVYQSQSYENHTIVNLETGDNMILNCFTNKSGCCKHMYEGGEGEWIFPNQSIVRRFSFGDDFYRNRGEVGEGVVNLIWNKDATIPTGIFCCIIPNPDQTACIRVYPEDEGDC